MVAIGCDARKGYEAFRMSALGHKQTYAVQNVMSALHPKADMCIATAHVCYGPIADFRHLLDHLVCAAKYCRRNGEAQCLRGFEIDHQFVLGRRLYRQVSGLFALEDAVNIRRCLSKPIDHVGSVGDQAAVCGKYVQRINA